MLINNNKPYDELLASVNIVDIISRYISVEKSGQNYQALCPFHDDRNPSLMISPTRQIFNCFVCHTGGNAIRFVQLYEKKTFIEAAQKIADIVNFKSDYFTKPIYVPPEDSAKTPLLKAMNDLVAYYQFSLLTEEGQEAKKYLLKRGLSEEDFTKYRIGFAPRDGKETISFLQSKGHTLKTLEDIGVLSGDLDHGYDRNQGRIIFTLINSEGQSVGFSARTLSNEKNVPKYVNSPETKLFVKSKMLYNYHFVKDLMAVQHVYLVEGFLDVMALDRVGVKSVVALMGTAFTKDQIAMLKLLNKEVRVFLDSDNAGRMATLAVIKDLMAHEIPFLIVRPNDEKLDPDDILKKHGAEVLMQTLNSFIAREDYIFSYYESANKRDDIETNKRFVSAVMNDVILHLKSRLEVSAFIERLSASSGFNAIILNEMYTKMRQQKDVERKAFVTVSQKLPLRQTLNKVAQAERFILYQMLVYPEARAYFDANVKIFTHEIHKYLANYLKEVMPSHSVNFAEILNDINTRFSDEVKINEYTQEIMDIEAAMGDVHYDLEVLNDANKTLQYERELFVLEKDHEKALMAAEDEMQYAKVMNDYLIAKKKLLKKYERK